MSLELIEWVPPLGADADDTMTGFKPYATFELLMDTGGTERANTLLCAACDAFARRGKPSAGELDQFAVLAQKLFPGASPASRAKAAATLGRSEYLSPFLEELVVRHLGDDLADFLVSAPRLAESTMLKVLASGDANLAAALARRADLSATLHGRLFQMNSRKVYRALAGNLSIAPKGPFLSALARSAQMDHQVAFSLAARKDFDAALLAPAFFDLSEPDRIKVITAFANRPTPASPIRRTLEQISVAAPDLVRALDKLFSENRRPEIANLLNQITGLDEVRCGQIAHDTKGAALFVVLSAFGTRPAEGLRVIVRASAEEDNSAGHLGEFARLFETVTPNAAAFMLSAWRGEVDLIEMTRPEFRASDRRRAPTPLARERSPIVDAAIEQLAQLGARAG